MNAELRINVAKKMHMVGHDFKGKDFGVVFCCHLSNDPFTAFCD